MGLWLLEKAHLCQLCRRMSPYNVESCCHNRSMLEHKSPQSSLQFRPPVGMYGVSPHSVAC